MLSVSIYTSFNTYLRVFDFTLTPIYANLHHTFQPYFLAEKRPLMTSFYR